MGNDNHIALSMDIDWAADFVLEDLFTLLFEVSLPCTLFCTHTSPAVEKLLALPNCERAIHPNFLPPPGENTLPNAKQVIRQVVDTFGKVKGVRNHVLFYHSRLLPLFREMGINYFSNDLMFLQENLHPYYDWCGLVRIPIYWEDDVHALYFKQQFSLETLKLDTPGLKVLNFHPIHLYLNSPTMNHYEHARESLRNENDLKKHIFKGEGIRSLFQSITSTFKPSHFVRLDEISDQFRKQTPYTGHAYEALSRS